MNRRYTTSIIHNWILVTLILLIPGVIGDRGFHSVGGIPIAAIFGIFVAIAILVLCCRFLCRPGGQRGRMIRQFDAPVTIVTQTGPLPTHMNPSPTPFAPLMYPTSQPYTPVTSAYPTTTATTTSSQMPYPQYPPPPTSTTVPPTRPQYPYPVYPPTDSGTITAITTTATPYPSYPPVPSAPPPSAPSLVDYGNIAPPAYSSLYPDRVGNTNVNTNTTTSGTSGNQ